MKKLIIIFLNVLIFSMCISSLKAQVKNPRNTQYNWETDTTKRTFDLSEIILVVPRNTFPQIDFPDFIGRKKGEKLFLKHEPVMSVEINNEAKAYPLNMLIVHEISNDSLGGIPILTTYCPLCNSSVVFDRRLKHNGNEYLLEFEVSGMLRNSNMILADKLTESWWQQFTGTGIVGDFSDAKLKIIPSMIISVEDFFKRYPYGKILSPEAEASSQEKYGTNPYVNYDSETGKPYEEFFDYTKLDTRLPPMERIINVKGSNGYKIYPFSIIAEKGTINDKYNGMNIVIFYKKGTLSILDNKEISKSKDIGSATVFLSTIYGELLTFENIDGKFVDNETKSIWDITGLCIKGHHKGEKLTPITHGNHFAFAWLTFHPESEIYR